MAGDDSNVRCVQGHSVLIHDRGGKHRVHQLIDLSSVQWGRALDAKTQGVVSISGRACRDQADAINDVAAAVHRYEMVIFRGDKRVWEGPIEQVETVEDTAIITANDVKHYLDTTPVTKDWPIATGEQKNPADSTSPWLMTERIRTIINYELSTDYQMKVGTGGATSVITVPRWETLTTPANVKPYLDIRRSDTLYSRSNLVAFQMYLGEHLDRLAEGGLDYTVLGRSLIIWDSAVNLYSTRRLSDEDFYGSLRVIASGSTHANVGHVSAQRPDLEPDYVATAGVVPGVGNAGKADDYYGVWTTIHSMDQEEGADEPTQDELNSQAQRLLVGTSPVPTEIRVPEGAGIRLSETLTIDDLVPGTIMPVSARLNIRQVSQDQRLIKMDVTETANDGERITVTLKSAGEVSLIGGVVMNP